MFLLRTITGICKLCRSEHGAALVVEPASPELQPSPAPIAASLDLVCHYSKMMQVQRLFRPLHRNQYLRLKHR